MPIKTLVLEDEAVWREHLVEVLKEEGHAVQSAENLSKARELLATGDFHLAVIDIVLEGDVARQGEERGLDLLEDIAKFNQEPGKFCGPVIFTGNATLEDAILALRQGAFDFLKKKPEESIVLKRGQEGKGFVTRELLEASRKVLRRVLLERSRRYEKSRHTLCFDLILGQKTRAELSGRAFFSKESTYVLDIDVDRFAGRADDLQFHFSADDEKQRLKWRPRAKDIGDDLHQKLLSEDAELMGCLAAARTQSGSNPLHLVFRGSQDLIRLPLELLPGELGYLIMDDPLTRQISGVMSTRKGIDHVFLEETPEIKVLLLGSNTEPPIPGVDEEIEQLQRRLPNLFESRGFNCTVHTIPTEEASYDKVYNCLDRCQYHMVHYAGHGFHDEENTDESGIAFWDKQNKSRRVKPMPIRILKHLLRNSDTRFFYLSCCVGAKGAPLATLRLSGNDFQGIVEGLVRVGIPGVLGYRWNVWDTEAKQLALAFYENLLTDLRLDTALFKARRALEEDKYYNETWASPVLVMQHD